MNVPRKETHLGESVFTIDGVLSAEDCAEHITSAEAIGFHDAPVTTSRGFVMMPDLRNNTRVILDDPDAAHALWGRVAEWIPRRRLAFTAIGLNERFRLYRYGKGQRFAWHRDGAFVRNDEEQSFLTLMVYLNDNFEGGTTDFDTAIGDLSVVPVAGRVLVFDHHLRHQGAPVTGGTKYVLRTDVMFRRS